jgi:hypothetical protein
MLGNATLAPEVFAGMLAVQELFVGFLHEIEKRSPGLATASCAHAEAALRRNLSDQPELLEMAIEHTRTLAGRVS